jgi:hypothetical protein
VTTTQRILSVCTSLLALAAWTRAAEPPADPAAAIREGLALYEKGKPAEAIRSLQQAIDLIQQHQQAGVETFLPKAVAGWKAGEIEHEQFAGGATDAHVAFFRVSRTFTRDADDVQLKVAIMNAPDLIAPQREMVKAFKDNPVALQAMNQDPNAKTEMIDKDGWLGWQRVDKGGPESQVILVTEALMLEISLGAADAATLGKCLEAIDLKALAKAVK